MTDHAPVPGTAPDPGVGLGDELARLMRVMQAFKAQGAGSGPEARERAAHVLLFPLTRLGPLRQGALAELVHADPSTVSRHVTLLVDRGLVRRVADEQDGRASRLTVTPAGEAALEQLRDERNAHLAAATTGWAPEELAAFTAALQRFVQDLTDHLPTLAPAARADSEKDR
jgi:DNA-binding MarR family transcriptional regulator